MTARTIGLLAIAFTFVFSFFTSEVTGVELIRGFAVLFIIFCILLIFFNEKEYQTPILGISVLVFIGTSGLLFLATIPPGESVKDFAYATATVVLPPGNLTNFEWAFLSDIFYPQITNAINFSIIMISGYCLRKN
jgi:multisubunit Na+/H+ antiporter MnhB subunit